VLELPAETATAIEPFLTTIREQTLATSLTLGPATGAHVQDAALDDVSIRIGVTKA
jgi:hypothetical protein